MAYTHLNFGVAKQRLAQMLGDPGKVFFTDHELGRYIVEALNWWGLTAMYFRETGRTTFFPTIEFHSVFDILNSTGTEFLQDFTFRGRNLVNDINYALMEPQITNWSGGWIGSEMFSLDEVTVAVQETLEESLKLTATVTTNGSTLFLPISGVRTNVSSAVDENRFIRILRAHLLEPGTFNQYVLWPVDQVQLQTTTKSTILPHSGRPKSYSVSYSPQLTVDVWPPPDKNYTLVLFIARRDAFVDWNLTQFDRIPFFQQDAVYVLKYGALAKLFSGDGLARAPRMAEYCEVRYREGIEMMLNYQSLLWAEMAGVRRPITTVAQLDMLRPTWSSTFGTPRTIAMLNWSFFGVYPKPTQNFDVTFEMIRKAILPTQDSDFIQVGKESMQAIYDYAQHVALLKCQGAEFENSFSLYESARSQALDYRQQVASQSPLYRDTQLGASQNRWFQPIRRKLPVDASREDRKLEEV